jgi:trehalose 6-phosphate synthase/phosphatase
MWLLSQTQRQSAGVSAKIAALRQLYKGCKIIVGRDKLDKTKGVLPKVGPFLDLFLARQTLSTLILRDQFQAFERLLQDYPQWVGRTVLIQVTAPSASDNPELATKVSEMVDHINVSQTVLEPDNDGQYD